MCYALVLGGFQKSLFKGFVPPFRKKYPLWILDGLLITTAQLQQIQNLDSSHGQNLFTVCQRFTMERASTKMVAIRNKV